MHEVVGLGDGTIGGTLRATLPELTWGHRQTFGYLEDMAQRLREEPRGPHAPRERDHALPHHDRGRPGPGRAAHDGADARELDLLPGFQEGIRNVSTDEQRHIAFGVRMLADLYASDPEPMQEAIIGTFREVLPMSTCVAQIPGWDLSYTRSLGYDLEDLYEEGARMSEARLRAIGLPLDDIPNFPLPLDMPPRERGERGIKLMKAQYLGPKEGAFARTPRRRRSSSTRCAGRSCPGTVRPGTVIQWDFTDAEPWHLVVDNGATRAARGRAPQPILVLRTTLEDWVDVTAGRVEPGDADAAPAAAAEGRAAPDGAVAEDLRLIRLDRSSRSWRSPPPTP